MFPNKMPVRKIGDCEVKNGHTNVEVFLQPGPGNIYMCAACRDEENLRLSERAKNVLRTSQKTDSLVELKQDIFNAGTTSFIELQAAYENNQDIPADKKKSALLAEVDVKIKKLTDEIFADKAATLVKENLRQALIVNAQELHAKLEKSEREKYPQFAIDYNPKPQTVKPTKVVRTSKSSTLSKTEQNELYTAAKKYNVPASNVRSLVISHAGWSYEKAAKHFAGLMGLPMGEIQS